MIYRLWCARSRHNKARAHQISDFEGRMTRYQVEHIAGVRGSRTKYIPARCDILRTHGICPTTDEICKKYATHLLIIEKS